MVIGTCDPASRGNAYNTLQLALNNGAVTVEARYGWDGVSTRPECDGPLVNGTGSAGHWAIQAVNNTARAWYLHAQDKFGNPKTYALAAGQTQTVTAAQAAGAGFSTASDLSDITLTDQP